MAASLPAIPTQALATGITLPVYNTPSRSSRGFVASVISRWPLLLIGIVAGAIAGYFGFSQMSKTYESSAKLLVIKKRDAFTISGDSRAAFVEDYISTQLAIIRSERILLPAARALNPDQFDPPLPQDPHERYQYVATLLTVLRDRESGTATTTGSSVLNISIRGLNPRDVRVVLEKVIEIYKQEVQDVYNKETRNLINDIETQIKTRKDTKTRLDAELALNMSQKVKVTPEEPRNIISRISATQERINALEGESIQVKDELELIKNIGPDRLKRAALFRALGGQANFANRDDPNSPEANLRILNAQKQEMIERGLGDAHELMKKLDAQIKYYVEMQAKQNPTNPTGELDELAILDERLKQKKNTLDLQLKFYIRLQEDYTAIITNVTPITTKIDQIQSNLASNEKEIQVRTEQVDILKKKTTQEGGYEITELTNPRNGMVVGPNLFLWLFGGVVLGVLGGGGLAFLAEVSDKSFRSPAEIRERLGVPIYGHIPDLRKNLPPDVVPVPQVDASLVSVLRPKSIEAEAYRGVRAQLMFAMQNRSHQVIQVTSPNPGDGKSTLAANLAVSLAQTGKKVILLDCDFRKPRVHKIFNLQKPEIGLASVTNGTHELNDAIRHDVLPNLDLLPCGPRPNNPAELLTGLNFQDVLTKLRTHYDYVIIDTPPLLAVSDPRVVAQRVDGVLIVFKITKRARPTTERAREQLADMGANILGVIVNGAGSGGGDYSYGYSYKYAYAYDYEYAEQYVDEETGDIVKR